MVRAWSYGLCGARSRVLPTPVSPGSCRRCRTRVAPHADAPTPSAPPAVRDRVLAGWAASPARFREDANAEEDLVRGGYRDRLLVELAQNAADAAARAGVPGRLRLELDGRHPARRQHRRARWTPAGVQGLATLRASAKRDEDGDRRPLRRRLRRGAGGERRAGGPVHGRRRAVQRRRGPGPRSPALPALADELARRGRRGARCCGCRGRRRGRRPTGSPPRSCCRCAPAPARPSTTRPGRAAGRPAAGPAGTRGRSRSSVDGTRRTLTIAPVRRPGPGHRRRDGRRSGRSRSAPASCPPRSLADRPVEERVPPRLDGHLGGARWTTTASRARCPAGQVVHAPTPSDEPLSLPLRLIAPFPLGPDRRHVAPGAGHRRAGRRGRRHVRRSRHRAAGRPGAAPRWCPARGLAGAALDAALGAAVLERLRSTSWLPVAGEDARRASRPTGPPRSTRRPTTGWRSWPTCCRVCCRPTGPGDRTPRRSPRSGSGGSASPRSVEAVRGVDRPPSWWARLYAALDGADREELAALPVPLADGRTAHGPAGVLLPEAGLPVERLGPLGLRLAEPGRGRAAGRPPAAGAARRPSGDGGRRARRPRRPQRRRDVDGRGGRRLRRRATSPTDLARAVLALVAAARPAPGELPWLGRAGAAGRRRRLGAGRRAGAARVGAGRRAGGRRARDAGPGARRDRRSRGAARGRRARHVRAGARGRTPTSWTWTTPTGGPTPCSTGCPPDAPAAGVAAADRRARPRAGRATGAARCRCSPRSRRRRGPTSCSAG